MGGSRTTKSKGAGEEATHCLHGNALGEGNVGPPISQATERKKLRGHR